MKVLLIGGTWDDSGGKPSGYISKVASVLYKYHVLDMTVWNGGKWDQLNTIVNVIEPTDFDVIFWFPNIPNEKEKLVGKIKKISPTSLLVTSKRNDDGKYSFHHLVARALKSKSNLVVEVRKAQPYLTATILDPLGNVFLEKESQISEVVGCLVKRILELKSYTRQGSFCLDEGVSMTSPPNESIFFQTVKDYADTFHDLIHAANKSRLLGNASFRCERGFPSLRHGNTIFVSRRNIDKRFIDRSGFVAVGDKPLERVEYVGEHKPSVDTPIQIRLYDHYPKINYMLHSHTYIEGAPFTEKVLPCGCLEEFDEIVKLIPERETYTFSVNLRGHGSIRGTARVDGLQNIPFISRPSPEYQM